MIPAILRGKFGYLVFSSVLVYAGFQMVSILGSVNHERHGPVTNEMTIVSALKSLEKLQYELRHENATKDAVESLVSIVREQNARIEVLKQEAVELEKKLNLKVSTSSSNSQCPFFGGNVLPNIQNKPIGVWEGNKVRDNWIANIAKSTPPGAAVLDMSSGERPYQKLFDHCKYHSHEFEGNKQIEDTLRGPGANKAGRKYDYVGERLKKHAFDGKVHNILW